MPKIRTVLGDIESKDLGFTLDHEHLIFNWAGGRDDHAAQFDREQVIQKMSAELKAAKDSWGLGSIVEVTTPDMGRDMELMTEASRRSSVHVVAATGLYTESTSGPYYWRLRPLDAVEEFFHQEITKGAVGSKVKAGVIKVASGPRLGEPEGTGRLTELEVKFFRAAARVSKKLGVAVTTHTDPADWRLGNIGLRQLEVLESEGADPSRCIIGHADGNTDIVYFEDILKRGANIGIDSIGYETNGFPSNLVRVGVVAALCALGYSGQLLLSYDRVFHEMRRPPSKADPRFANELPLDYIPREFIPALLKAGVTEKAIEEMTVESPRHLLAF